MMKAYMLSAIKQFLFHNTSTRQTVAKNTFWLGSAEIMTRISRFVLLIYAARLIGAEGYGVFSFALALVSIFSLFSDFGTSQIFLRDHSRKDLTDNDFNSFFSLKIILTIGTAIVIGISTIITPSIEARLSIIFLGIFVLANSFGDLLFALLKSTEKMQWEALLKIIQTLLIMVVGIAILLIIPNPHTLSFTYAFMGLASIGILTMLFHKKIHRTSFSWEQSRWKEILRAAWPLGMVTIFVMIYNYIDSVMLGVWGLFEQNGWYNAAYRVVGIGMIPGVILSQTFYPALSKSMKESKERFKKIWDVYWGITIATAIPLITGGVLLAKPIMRAVYGAEFDPAISAFQILVVGSALLLTMGPLSHTLILANQQKKNFWVAGAGALFNITTNIIFIPLWGLYGAALTTLLTALLMWVAYFILNKFYAHQHIISRTIRNIIMSSIIASGIMMLTFSFMITKTSAHIFWIILLSVIQYALCMMVLTMLSNKIASDVL